KDAGKFLRSIRRCGKPLVIFKAGRTERGRKAAESHTRSLAGRDEIYDAVFRQYGVHRASSLEDLYDFSKALACLPAPAGPRMLIVTSSGGSAIIATDVAEEEGFRVAPLPPELAATLKEILPSHCIVGNPLDLTGDTDAARYRKVLEASAGHYDVVMPIFGDPIPGASGVITPGRCELVAYLGGADVERAERALMHEKGIAVFPTPERAVRALSCHARFRRDRFPRTPGAAEAGRSETGGREALSPVESMRLLSESGFPVVPFRHADNEEEAVFAARSIGYPVAVKLNSPDVTHKSDIGGVILNAADEQAVRRACRDISLAAKRAGARDEGVLVSAMAKAGREVIVGVVKDLQFGHAVMFGMGGILVEALGDVTFRIVPLSEKDAAEMIGEIRGNRLLHGYRGEKPVDIAAVRQLLLQVSELVSRRPEIEELDLNPVIVHETGLQVVDARVIPAGGA
ncbi:MAG: acetate--CoA ligase family protein, partial [Deltaproteobacteria bacterium]|nr:acetate--CoA ligase family protein [Candidatus Deferrimicrobiaceae bacterium]